MKEVFQKNYQTIRVRARLGPSIGSLAFHLLGIVANIVLLFGAAASLIYLHQQMNYLSLLGLDIGAHPVTLREVRWWICGSLGCHIILGLSALVVHRSRYCLSYAAVALSTVAWVIWLLAYSVGLAALLYSNNKPFVLKWCFIMGGGVVWAALTIAGAKVFALARRKSLKPASKIVEGDPGRYFLYLRSFVADSEASPDRSPFWYFASLGSLWVPLLLNPFYFVSFRRQNPEEIILLNGMARIFPVVAIGEPGERVPPLGASRIYAEHECWQQVATSLADNSCAVLILPHSTAGVVWEFTELCLRTHPSKAVIILPHALASLQWSRSDRITHHADLWTTFLTALTNHPMVHSLPASLPSDALAMTFTDDWSPLIWSGTPHTSNFRQIARYVALNAASPTFKN